MHGTLKQATIPASTDSVEGWTPYIPGFFRWREVIRQIGHEPTLYVMRKRDGWKWLYRDCTPQESSRIEKRDTGA